MKKMRLFVPLLVILVMGMATSAFAQLNCAVATGTISRATLTGHAEPVGDISFTCTPPAGAAGTGNATITVQYPVTITNTAVPAYPTLAPIRITDNVGSFGPGAAPPTIAAVSNTTGQILINVPGQAFPGAGAFTLRGVLVSLVGTVSTTNLQANISVSPPQTAGSNVLINSGDNTPTVITSIMNGINTTTAPPALLTGTLPAVYLGNGSNVVPARGGFTVTTTENYIDMFRSALNMTSNNASNSTQLQYTFSGMAAGSTLTNCSAAVFANGVATPAVLVTPSPGAPVSSAAAGAAGTTTLTVAFTGATVGGTDSPNQNAIEEVRLSCGSTTTLGFSGAGVAAGSLPITAPITATVTLHPTGSALQTAPATLNQPFTSTTSGPIPRYASTPISIGTVITFTPATTTLLIPYVVTSKDALAYDTGISIANTTADAPSFNTATTGAALDQSGTITFTFFPSDGSASSSFTTAAAVPAGGSYIANISNILPLATPAVIVPTNGYFTGYVFAVANFTNGHGAAFVYGGTAANRITSTTDVLVLASPLVQPRNSFPLNFPQVEYTTK